MTKRPPLAVILLVIFACFALGLLNVLLRDNVDPTSTPTPFAPSPTDTISSSINSILIVGVDDLGYSAPQVRAIWIAAYRSSGSGIFFHGIPLDATVPGEDGKTITDVFQWSPEAGLNKDFTDALFGIIQLRPSLTILLDDHAFAKTIDYLGGVEIRGKVLDGESVLTFLSLSWDRPGVLIVNQADIIQSLIPKALDLPEAPELTELLKLIPEHVYTSMEINQAVAFVLPLRQTDMDSIFLILPEEDS